MNKNSLNLRVQLKKKKFIQLPFYDFENQTKI